MTWNPGASLPLPPPIVPVAYAEPTPPRRENRVAILISWLVIIGVIAFVGVENWRSSHDPRMERAVSSIEMEITSRGLIGYATLLRKAGMSGPLEAKMPDLARAATASATGASQSLMAVTVVGELQGKAAALARLKSIKPQVDGARQSAVAVDRKLQADYDVLQTIYSASPDELSAKDRTTLESDLGWFGKLALVAGLPDSNPLRHSILKAAMRATVATFSVEILLVVALVAGLVLLIIATVKLTDGKLKLNYKPAPFAGSAFIEMFALYIVGFVSIGRIAHALHATSLLTVYGFASIWIIACCFWPRVRGLSFSEIRTGLGWTTGRGILTEAAMGVVGYIAFLPILALAVVVTAILGRISHEHAMHPIIFEAATQSKSAIIGLYLLASGFAPIVEETMFRGALFHHLRRTHRWLLSALLTGLIFAAIHPQGWTAIPVLGGIGFAFCGIREWRGNVIASATAHAMNNAVAMTMMFLILG